MRVFITGANGFVGSAASKFLIARNIPIIRVVRNKSFIGQKDKKIGEVLSYEEFYKTNLSVNDSVIHCAGLAHQVKEKRVEDIEYYKSNAIHPFEVFNHASHFKIKRFILISSASVYGLPAFNERISENHECEPIDVYGRSKLLSEKLILRRSRYLKRTSVIIIRPPMIYGKGAPGNYSKLVKLVNSSLPLPLGAFHAKRSVLHINNLCDFLLKILNSENKKNNIFNLADPFPISVAELVKKIPVKSKKKVWILSVNPKIVLTLSYLVGKSKEISKINQSLHLNCDHVEKTIGWHPNDKLEV